MTHQPQRFHHIIAFEVAKQNLTVHVLPDDRQEVVANSQAAVRRVLRREAARNQKTGLGSMLVVCEATGGYERHVLDGAAELNVALHRAHGSRTRFFARYLGLAKTDPIDARMLARYGRDTPDLRLYRPPAQQDLALRALRKRRDELAVMLRMETNRLEHARQPRVLASIRTHAKAMTKELAALDAEIATLIAATPHLDRKARLMRTLKGIGPVTAAACLAYLPELGALTKGQLARLAGLAPIANDSGTLSSPRHIAGGRSKIREPLYMAALVAIVHNPAIAAFASSLRQRGKPAKLVIVAVMRKLLIILNAILRDGQPARLQPA